MRKRILNYPGGKWRVADWIISYFPPHHSYLEPFFGSGAVLFSKPRSSIETINDLDGDVVNFFEWVKKDPERLAREIYLTPYARRVYDASFLGEPRDSLEQDLRFCIKLNMGYGQRTNGEKTGWKKDIQGRERAYNVVDWNGLPERVLEAAERLRMVQIENRPATEVIKNFQDQKVLVYCDPPYVLETRNREQYRHEMGDDAHEELLDMLARHKGYVVISGYDSPLYRKKLEGWRREETASYTQSLKKRKEVI